MYRPAASPAICIVRHGVVKLPVRTTGAPLADGVRCARRRWPSTRRSHIDA